VAADSTGTPTEAVGGMAVGAAESTVALAVKEEGYPARRGAPGYARAAEHCRSLWGQ